MPIEDYLPNVFGGNNAQIAGLLGDGQAGQLSRQSNVVGLLSAAAALAQGMSPQGYRRSPLQNVLTSLAAGYQGAGGAYQHGLQALVQQQQLQANMDKQAAFQQAAAQYPELAPLFRIAPEKAAELIAQMQEDAPIKQAFKNAGVPSMAPQAAPPMMPQPVMQAPDPLTQAVPQPSVDYSAMPAQEQAEAPQGEPLPPITVTPTPTKEVDPAANLQSRKDYLMRVYANLDGASSKRALDIRKQINDEVKLLDEQMGQVRLSNLDVASLIPDLPDDLKPRALVLEDMKRNKLLTGEQFAQRLDALFKDARLNTADIQEYQYAKQNGFKGSFQDWVQYAGRARAPQQNVTVGDLSKATQAKVEEKALSSGDAITRLNDIQASYRPEYQDIRFRFGQGLASIKDKFNALPAKDQQTLAAYSKYKQTTVQNLNATIKDLTGASMGVDEAKRIISTLPNPGLDLFDGDSPTEFQAKLDNAVAQTKYSLARQTYALRKGLKWDSIPLDKMPSLINERGKQIAKEYKLDPNKPADMQTIQRQLAAEFGIGL